MRDVVIASACRTAIGTFGGALRDSDAVVLGACTMKEAIRRCGIDPSMIDDIRYGCCLKPPDAANIARVAGLMAGIPDTTPAVTINRVCVSGMETVISGMAMIKAGLADVILAGGVEHMSGVPYAVPGARWGCRLQDQAFVDLLIHFLHGGSHFIPHPKNGPVDSDKPPLSFFKGKPYMVGHTAEFIAQYMGISREEMDEVALRSHNEAERATKDGSFEDEIVSVEVPQRKGGAILFERDEHFRQGLTIESLRKLPPAFVPEVGKVTAGNSSGINDGSSGMIIMAHDKARELSIEPLGRIRAAGIGACHPSVMGLSPVAAVNDLMARSGLKIQDFELVEVNEAFAAQYLACEKEL